MTGSDLPEFTADEINRLRQKTYGALEQSRHEYYMRCLSIVEEYDAGELKNPSEKQMRWLWGIKADLKEG